MSQSLKPSPAGQIWYLLTPAERHKAIGLLFLMLGGMVLETLSIGLVIPAISFLTRPSFLQDFPVLKPVLEYLGNPNQKVMVAGGMTILVGLYLVKSFYLAFLAWKQMAFAFDLQAEISFRLFRIYLRQPYTFHLTRNTAQLINNAINEIQQLWLLVLSPAMSAMTEILATVGILTLLFIVEPTGALMVLGVVGGTTCAFHLWSRTNIRRWGEKRQYHDELRLQHLQQGLGGIKDVILLGREKEFLSQYEAHNFESARMGQYQSTVQQLPRVLLELFAMSGVAALVFTMLAQNKEMNRIVPAVGLFGMAAFRLMPSVNRILAAVISLSYAQPVITNLYEELQFAPQESPRPASRPPLCFAKELSVKHVSFRYASSSSNALNDISISIRKGECVGFLGTSGSGKTTLIDIILGLFSPDHGSVELDCTNIAEDLRGWQESIGYVPQSIYLTDDTLRRNIAFGLPENQINNDMIQKAINAAQLENFVSSLPNGVQTHVGERGVRLSGGQRQRIGIARALYYDPNMLVLDEATSALDTATEREIMKSISALHGAKTILIVAHRLTTVQNCDRLYRIENGRIAAEGTPDRILDQAESVPG